MKKYTRRRRVRLAMAAVAILGAGAIVGLDTNAEPAEAGWAGITGATGCTGINAASVSNLGVYYWNLSSVMGAAQDWVNGAIVNPTDLNVYGYASQTADVVYRDLDYASYCGYDWYQVGSGGTTGLTTCDSLVGSGACKTHSVRFSTNYTNIASTTARRGLACHETGHAIGLTHATSSTTCMTPGNTSSVNQWNPTEIGWINAFY
jgi:hypothetical protein